MTKKIDQNPEHWHDRADNARKLAMQISDPLSRRKMLEIAEGYESLAHKAAQQSPWNSEEKK
jgi:hypothetical protein